MNGDSAKAHLFNALRKLLVDPLSYAAIMISCASLYIAVTQVRIAERTLSAQVWPSVSFEHGNWDAVNRRQEITLELVNGGVGPARIDDLRVTLDDSPVLGIRDLLYVCCATGPEEGEARRRRFEEFLRSLGGDEGMIVSAAAVGKMLKAGDSLVFATVPKTPANRELSNALDEARWRMKVEVCYCSVLDECWTRSSASPRPVPVARCMPQPDRTYKE